MSTFKHSLFLLIYKIFYGYSEHGYYNIWRYQINTISLQVQELFEPLCKVKQVEVV